MDGESYASDAERPRASANTVAGGFFETFGIPVGEGRDFERAETERDGEPVALVSRSFVNAYLGGGNALGRTIRMGGAGSENPWLRIIGVVPDVHPGVATIVAKMLSRALAERYQTPIDVALALSPFTGRTAPLTPQLKSSVTSEPAQTVQYIDQASTGSMELDEMLVATPIDLRRVVDIQKPAVRASYELEVVSSPTLEDVLADRLELIRP